MLVYLLGHVAKNLEVENYISTLLIHTKVDDTRLSLASMIDTDMEEVYMYYNWLQHC